MNRSLLSIALVAGTLLAGGCVGYNVYPPEQGTGGFTNPNSPPVYQLMRESLKWAVRKYPPGGQTPPSAAEVPIPASEADSTARAGSDTVEPRIAISLFTEMDPQVYKSAVREIGEGAVPLTPETEHLPRYSVGRVWVCGDEAKVDIFKPVLGMGTDDGAPLAQPITVTLRGGMQFWRVTSYRVWSIGTFPPPGPEYLAGSYVPPAEPIADPAPEEPVFVPADAITTPAAEPQGEVPPDGAPSDPR